ncbi:MAG: CDP-alcohol phosphatidyltransferase family protein [Planctomycetaceae bacterium]
MLDRSIRRLVDPLLEPLAQWVDARGVSANTVTIAGFVVGMGSCWAIAAGCYGVGLVLLLGNRLADGVDGAVAWRRGATDLGGFLDIVLDILFYGGVPLSFAIADSGRLLAASVLNYSFMATSGSFLAFAVISAKRGITSGWEGQKAFYYSVGLMEGTETILIFVLFCLFPNQFNRLAWTFAGLCWLTALIRIATAAVLFTQPAAASSPTSVTTPGRDDRGAR